MSRAYSRGKSPGHILLFGTGRFPLPDKRCRLNRSMQHRLVDSIDSTSPKCSIWTAVLNKNLNRAFVLFELTATNEISLLDPYESTLGKCCVDPLRPPLLSECMVRRRVASEKRAMADGLR